MHDPSTQAWKIPNPFLRRYKWGKTWWDRPDVAIIWHVDPESDGSDDSCGWFKPTLTKDEVKKIKEIAAFEVKEMYEPSDGGKFIPKVDTPTGVYTIMITLAWQVWKKQLKPRHALDVMNLSFNYHDSFRYDFQPAQQLDMYDIERTFLFIGRNYLRMIRPWYKHPRWHIWHWQLQVDPILHFKRWLFSRCAKCGKGFKWGESPTTNQWNGTGPLWFRSETGSYHGSCMGVEMRPAKETT